MKRRSRELKSVESNMLRRVSILLILLTFIFSSESSLAQPKKKKKDSPKVTYVYNAVHDTVQALIKRSEWQFPVTKMWDDAIRISQKSHRPVMAFNVDYVDPNSISFRDNLLRDQEVMIFLSKNFELAVNDFSVDPPPEVGYDSLRNLGARLDGLEKGYNIVSRPTAILLNPDKTEIDRIPDLQNYEPARFIQRVKDYLAGKNTIWELSKEFWSDVKNLDKHKRYLDRLMERFDYDSILYHLTLLSTDPNYGQTPGVMKEAAAQYAYLRFKQEGNITELKKWLGSLDQISESAIISAGLKDLLEYYQSRKKIDSIAVYYEHIFAFEKDRDPDMLNNFAWDIANFSTKYDSALSVVNQAIAKNSKNPNYYDTRALIQLDRKEYDAAITDAHLALKYSGKDDKKYFKERIEYYEKEKRRILSEEKNKED